MSVEPDPQTWVLLRGLTREAGHWGDFVEAFRRRVPCSRVVPIDLPGNGAAHRLPSPTSVRSMACQARAAWGRDAQEASTNLLGLSLGAMVAVEWARQRPDTVRRCVLVNTSFRPFSPFWRRLRPSSYRSLLRLLLAADPVVRERIVLALTSRAVDGEGERAASIVAQWVGLRASHPVSVRNALRQLLAAARYRAPARSPVPGTLILAARRDRLVDPGCSRVLADRWGCDFRLHPDAGHDLPLDDADWVARSVADWIARGDEPDGPE